MVCKIALSFGRLGQTRAVQVEPRMVQMATAIVRANARPWIYSFYVESLQVCGQNDTIAQDPVSGTDLFNFSSQF